MATNTVNGESFVTIPEAAQHARCCCRTINRMIMDGRLPHYRVGIGRGRVRIKLKELENALRVR